MLLFRDEEFSHWGMSTVLWELHTLLDKLEKVSITCDACICSLFANVHAHNDNLSTHISARLPFNYFEAEPKTRTFLTELRWENVARLVSLEFSWNLSVIRPYIQHGCWCKVILLHFDESSLHRYPCGESLAQTSGLKAPVWCGRTSCCRTWCVASLWVAHCERYEFCIPV